MLTVAGATYAAVFVAEIVGDKLLYTSGVLATQYRWTGVLLGMAGAFMAKMAVAVGVGATVGSLLPVWAVVVMTAVGFGGVIVAMTRRREVSVAGERDAPVRSGVLSGAGAAFFAIFLSEWGDKGMTTAGLQAAAWASAAAEAERVWTGMFVWVGAVLAMVTKGALAVSLGGAVRRWLAQRVDARRMRQGAVAALVVLGMISVLEVAGLVEG